MIINPQIRENILVGYMISYDGQGIDIGDYVPKIGCDKVINGNLVKCTEEEYSEYLAKQAEKINQLKYEEAVNAVIREKYTLSQELAMHRQHDSKPEEYAAYNAYCEQCKAQAKIKYNIGE